MSTTDILRKKAQFLYESIESLNDSQEAMPDEMRYILSIVIKEMKDDMDKWKNTFDIMNKAIEASEKFLKEQSNDR